MKQNQNIELKRQLRRIQKAEERILNKRENPFMKEKITPITNKIQEKIPPKLKDTLELAFYKGFQLVFEKGSVYIEKTYDKDRLQLEHDLNNYAVDRSFSRKYMKKLDKTADQSGLLHSSFAVLEGGVLGFLGIGLPDIPLFIAVIIRNMNETALSYGFGYNREEEKAFLLALICGAVSKGNIQKECDGRVEALGSAMDAGLEVEINLKEEIRKTSDLLSETMLTAKFIQGIPLVGTIGGVVNFNIMNQISQYAKLKYKKRYLLNKINGKIEGNNQKR